MHVLIGQEDERREIQLTPVFQRRTNYLSNWEQTIWAAYSFRLLLCLRWMIDNLCYKFASPMLGRRGWVDPCCLLSDQSHLTSKPQANDRPWKLRWAVLLRSDPSCLHMGVCAPTQSWTRTHKTFSKLERIATGWSSREAKRLSGFWNRHLWIVLTALAISHKSTESMGSGHRVWLSGYSICALLLKVPQKLKRRGSPTRRGWGGCVYSKPKWAKTCQERKDLKDRHMSSSKKPGVQFPVTRWAIAP